MSSSPSMTKKLPVYASAEMLAKCGWTPYDGFEATGWPVATIIRSGFVMRDGEIVKKGGGQPVRFNETLEPIS